MRAEPVAAPIVWGAAGELDRSATEGGVVRLHPITIGLRALRGERSIHGRPLPCVAESLALLRHLTGQDFGSDAAAWGTWLRANRWVYHASPDGPRGNRG